MIDRYTRPEMGHIWSEQNKFQQWLAVELAASEALAERGEVPADAAALLRQHASFSVDRINAIEKEVRHDVIAFTTSVAETMKEAGFKVELGMTMNSEHAQTYQGTLVSKSGKTWDII